jgi:hypothetical protein
MNQILNIFRKDTRRFWSGLVPTSGWTSLAHTTS